MGATNRKLDMFLILFMLLSLSKVQNALETDSNSQQDILEALLDTENGYDPRIRPPTDTITGKPEVNVSMYILDVPSVDDFNMEFTISCYFRQNWIDPRLRFDGSNDDVKYLHVNDYDKIWKPDLFFVEEKVGKFHSTLTPNSFMRIKPNGEILYSARLTLTLRCIMDVSMYPFDTQKCGFSIESYGYNSHQLNIAWDNVVHVVGGSEDISSYGFELKGIPYTTSEVSLQNTSYKRLSVELIFSRKTGFFLIKLYIPFIILVIVSWLSFWIKPKLLALRLTLLLCVLALMLYLASDINNYVPPASYTKGIDVWTAVCISLVFAEFLEFILISKFTRRNKAKHFHQNVELASNSEADRNSRKDTELPISDKCLLPTSEFSSNTSWAQNWAQRADFVSKWLFPALFGLFNMIYWPTFASRN